MSQHDDVVKLLLDPSEHLPEHVFEDILVYVCTNQDINLNFVHFYPATTLCKVSRRFRRFAMGRRCWPVLGAHMFRRLLEISSPSEFVSKDIRALYFHTLPWEMSNNEDWVESLYGEGSRVTAVDTYRVDYMTHLLNVGHPSTLRYITNVIYS